MNKSSPSILKPMLDIIRVHSFVRMVRKYNESAAYNRGDTFRLEPLVKNGPIEEMLEAISMENFKHRRVLFKKIDGIVARNVLHMALNSGYICTQESIYHTGSTTLVLTVKGNYFTSTPSGIGLLQALAKEYGLAYGLAISFMTGLITLGIVRVLASTWFHII